MIGNFLGDFVKGNDVNRYVPGVKRGVHLHRAIDMFTDNHDIVKKSKKRLWERHRHYAPVIVDVFYDHFLAKNWSQYSPISLKGFTENFYEVIRQNEQLLPEKAQHMFSYMSRDNWLYYYQYVEGVRRTLAGLASRTRFISGMEVATELLQLHYPIFEEEFVAFFPELQSHVFTFLKDH